MFVQIKINCEKAQNGFVCLGCWTGNVPMVNLTLRLQNGLDTVGPVCHGCLEIGVELDALIEQPDLRPGRQPPSRAIKRRSLRQEREIAQSTGGIRHKASGALPGLKGDARKKGVYRAEGKLSQSNQYILRRDVLEKIRSEASYGEVPAVVTTFIEPDTLRELDCWVTIPWSDFEEKIANAVTNDR